MILESHSLFNIFQKINDINIFHENHKKNHIGSAAKKSDSIRRANFPTQAVVCLPHERLLRSIVAVHYDRSIPHELIR